MKNLIVILSSIIFIFVTHVSFSHEVDCRKDGEIEVPIPATLDKFEITASTLTFENSMEYICQLNKGAGVTVQSVTWLNGSQADILHDRKKGDVLFKTNQEARLQLLVTNSSLQPAKILMRCQSSPITIKRLAVKKEKRIPQKAVKKTTKALLKKDQLTKEPVFTIDDFEDYGKEKVVKKILVFSSKEMLIETTNGEYKPINSYDIDGIPKEMEDEYLPRFSRNTRWEVIELYNPGTKVIEGYKLLARRRLLGGMKRTIIGTCSGKSAGGKSFQGRACSISFSSPSGSGNKKPTGKGKAIGSMSGIGGGGKHTGRYASGMAFNRDSSERAFNTQLAAVKQLSQSSDLAAAERDADRLIEELVSIAGDNVHFADENDRYAEGFFYGTANEAIDALKERQEFLRSQHQKKLEAIRKAKRQQAFDANKSKLQSIIESGDFSTLVSEGKTLESELTRQAEQTGRADKDVVVVLRHKLCKQVWAKGLAKLKVAEASGDLDIMKAEGRRILVEMRSYISHMVTAHSSFYHVPYMDELKAAEKSLATVIGDKYVPSHRNKLKEFDALISGMKSGSISCREARDRQRKIHAECRGITNEMSQAMLESCAYGSDLVGQQNKKYTEKNNQFYEVLKKKSAEEWQKKAEEKEKKKKVQQAQMREAQTKTHPAEIAFLNSHPDLNLHELSGGARVNVTRYLFGLDILMVGAYNEMAAKIIFDAAANAAQSSDSIVHKKAFTQLQEMISKNPSLLQRALPELGKLIQASSTAQAATARVLPVDDIHLSSIVRATAKRIPAVVVATGVAYGSNSR